jgi:hypothetical protein
MTERKVRTKEDLKVMADALEELQLSFEPVRDKALDQKAFYTGYAQFAEAMIKVMIARMTDLRAQAEQPEEEEINFESPQEDKEEKEPEVPLIVDPEPKKTTKRGRKKKPVEVET